MQAKETKEAKQSRTTSRLAHMKDILSDKPVHNRLEHTLPIRKTVKRPTINQHINKERVREIVDLANHHLLIALQRQVLIERGKDHTARKNTQVKTTRIISYKSKKKA